MSIASSSSILTDFGLGIFELGLEQTKLLELDLQLLWGLLVRGVVVRHGVRMVCYDRL